jgi:small subunit ribosomal protein S19
MAEEVIIRTKDATYRGISVEDLKKADVREFAKYLPSRSRRTVLRNFNQIEDFVKRCEKKNARGKKIKTHLRDLVIVPRMVGMVIQVYNGKAFNEVRISSNMLGHRLGEFSLTRSRVIHGDPGIGSTKGTAVAKK